MNPDNGNEIFIQNREALLDITKRYSIWMCIFLKLNDSGFFSELVDKQGTKQKRGTDAVIHAFDYTQAKPATGRFEFRISDSRPFEVFFVCLFVLYYFFVYILIGIIKFCKTSLFIFYSYFLSMLL